MKEIAAITAALESFKPEIAASFESIVHYQFNKMVERFGPTLKDAANERGYAEVYRNIVSPVIKRAAPATPFEIHTACSIDPDRLAKAAKRYADDTVAAWVGKIMLKLGEIEEGEVHSFAAASFKIFGKRGGKKIEIEQSRILNVSTKGTLFNQFPARIYVDGKFTSGAAYKKAFAPSAS